MALCLLLCFSVEAISQRNWTSRKNKNGVEVFVKLGENSTLKTYRAIATTSASVEKCSEVLLDLENHINWSYTVITAAMLPSSGDELKCYMVMDAPWPADDRDIVVRVTKKEISDTKVEIRFVATTGDKEEIDGLVRVTESTTVWIFERVDGVTHITYEGTTDPGGKVPDWMVNAGLVDGPYETLAGFLEQVQL